MHTLNNPLHLLYKRQYWYLANNLVLQAWLQHDFQTDFYGPRGKWVWRLMNIAVYLQLELLLTRIIGSLDVLRWWWKAGIANQALPEGCAIFVGFGAGPEENMWSQFYSKRKGGAVRLDQTKAATFGAFHRPSLLALLRDVWSQSAKASSYLASTMIEPIASYRLDYFTFTAMRLAQYVFFKCWWKGVRTSQIDHVVFISADIPAYACLDAGIPKVEFHQHGLLRRSILMPPFPLMKLLTVSEMRYFSELMPKCKIELAKPCEAVTTHQRIILLASIYDIPSFNKKQSLSDLKDFVEWADKNALTIIVRKHPRENGLFWKTYFPMLAVDASSDSFEDALIRLKPMMMVTWFSTTLIDALRCNVVPVTISSLLDCNVVDMVVSLKENCLSWSNDQDVLNKLINGDATVESVISRIEQSGTAC